MKWFNFRKKKTCKEYWAEALLAIRLEYPSASEDYASVDGRLMSMVIPEAKAYVYFRYGSFAIMCAGRPSKSGDGDCRYYSHSRPWLTKGMNQKVLLKALYRLEESA